MSHRLLTPPYRILQTPIRLPAIQTPGETVMANFQDSLIDRDSLRRTSTNKPKAIGPLPAVQQFVQPAGTNTRESMSSGLMIGNARRLATKTHGTSAGI